MSSGTGLAITFRPSAPGATTGTATAAIEDQVIHEDDLDLARTSSRDRFAQAVAELHPGLDPNTVAVQLVDAWLDQAEQEQSQEDDAVTPLALSKEALDATPEEVVADCRRIWSESDPIDLILQHADAMGIAGEESLVVALYLIGTSRLLARPLAGVVMGASSSGKSYVVSKVAGLFPPEAVLQTHRLTPTALTYLPPGTLVHRFVVAGERSRKQGNDAAEATRALREMISDGHLRVEVPLWNEDGQRETMLIEQPGPIAYLESTTLGIHEIFDEDRNRFVLLSPDESVEQDGAVMAKSARMAQGIPPAIDPDSIVPLHWTLQRLLEPCTVVIPFADKLKDRMPRPGVQVRRAFNHLLRFIEASVLLHQFHRTRDSDGRLIATLEDYNVIRRYLTEPLARSLGLQLTQGAEDLLGCLRSLGQDFRVSDAAVAARCNDSAARSRLRELAAAGQVEIIQEGRGGRSTIYRLAEQPPPLHGLVLPEL